MLIIDHEVKAVLMIQFYIYQIEQVITAKLFTVVQLNEKCPVLSSTQQLEEVQNVAIYPIKII